MRGWTSSRAIQCLLCVFASTAILLLLLPRQSTTVYRVRRLYHAKQEPMKHDAYTESAKHPSFSPTFSAGDIIDYSRCSPLDPVRIFVYPSDHPLSKALAAHPTSTPDQEQACIFFVFTNRSNPTLPCSFHSMDEPGLNHVLVNLNDDVTLIPEGKEMIVQANFIESIFRPLLDFSLSPDVPSFNKETWKQRPSIMPLKRKVDLVTDT